MDKIHMGIDQMIRECWQEDVKTFRSTACPLSEKAPHVLLVLSAEALAYEASLTGNREHLSRPWSTRFWCSET